MKKTIVGIAANHRLDAGEALHHLSVVYTPDGYVKGVREAGGLPMILPMSGPETAADYVAQVDKLILAGGQNIAPKFYRSTLETEQDDSYLPRDEFELALIEAALLQKKPIFAVCRGMQLLNVAFGGTLIQSLGNRTEIQHMQAPIPITVPTHELRTKKASTLQNVYGEHTQVNSFHNQAIDRLAANFQETAWSPDEVIEGIEDTEHRLLGVQWHPDFAFDALEQERAIFDYVVHEL